MELNKLEALICYRRLERPDMMFKFIFLEVPIV